MNSTKVGIDKISETELLSFLASYAVDNDFPLALWRLPNASSKHLIISHQHQILEKDYSLEELKTGFIFSPFDKEKAKLFLPGDFIFSFENNSLKSPVNPTECASASWLAEKLKTDHTPKKIRFKNSGETVGTNITHDNFLELINVCLEEIEKGTFEKIVPSRTKHIDLPADFDVIKSFEKLCARYPNALISFVSIPGVGNWLGATPEVLVSIEDKNIFKTVALAGTKSFEDGMNLKSVAWTQKEIEEQALVERYIISCFKKIRLREYDEQGPKTIVAGNLLHLRSEFTVDMEATGFPQLGSIMIQLLHPTSAVCGMPLDISLDFLRKHEGYDRSFYSGYLGPVNFQNNIYLFVNLRCMQLLESKGILYAGAGVTIDSVPAQEWEETEIKFNTLLNVIVP
jgi:isochorismate synthase